MKIKYKGQVWDVKVPEGATKDQIRSYLDSRIKPEETSTLGAVGRGALQGVTANFADNVLNQLSPEMGEQYSKYLKMDREQHPVASIGGQVAGAIPTAFIPGMAGLKGAAMIGGASALGEAVDTDTSMGEKGVQTAIGAGLGTLGYGAGKLIGAGVGKAATATKGAVSSAVKGSKTLQSAKEYAKDLMTPVWSRANDIFPGLGDKWLFAASKATVEKKPFVEFANQFDDWVNKFPKKHLNELKHALYTSDKTAARTLVQQYGTPEFNANFDKIWDDVLDPLWQKYQEVGLGKTYIQDYFPIRYKQDRLDEFFQKKGLTKEFDVYVQRLFKKHGKALTPEEKAQAYNSFLEKRVKPSINQRVPSNLKERKIKNLQIDDMDFVQNPNENLHRYIHDWALAREKKILLGHSPTVGESFGWELEKMNQAAKAAGGKGLDPNQLNELSKLTEARYGRGELHPHRAIQVARNLGYMGTIANPLSALTQVPDLAIGSIINGVRNTVSSIFKSPLKGTKLTPKDLGIIDVASDLADASRTAKWLDKTLKASGFWGVDMFGKKVFVRGAFRKLSQMSDSAIQSKYGNVMSPAELGQTIADLRAGNATPNLKSLLLMELTKVQPINLVSHSKTYLNSPNGRIFYTLKTWTLTQLDLIRREALQKPPAEAAKFLAKYGIVLGMAGASIDQTKEWLKEGATGKTTENTFGDHVINNLLKMSGVSKYYTKQFSEGQGGEAVAKFLAPAGVTIPFEIGSKVAAGKPEQAFRYVPVIGPGLDWWLKE